MRLARHLLLAIFLITGFAPAFAQSPTPVPPLPDTERRTSYTISSSKCSCAVGFAIYGDGSDFQNWVEVWVNGARAPYNDPSVGWTLTSPTIATLSSAARPITNAVITFNSAQTGTVQIVGARKPRRVSQYLESRGVPARDFNRDITDLVAQNRETWDKINDVSGRAVLAPPGETLNVLATAASRANSGACFDANGQLVPCVSIPSTTFSAGNGIAITGTSPKTITNNIQGSGPITITGTNPLTIGCPTCNTSPAAATPAIFVVSRAAATGLDLSSFTVVRTGGRTAGGDGGGATFKNVGSAPFTDSAIATGSVTGVGSSYTNGTYTNVALTGGTGSGARATITVAGNVVTGFTLTNGGSAYTVGDVLSANSASIGGTGSGFTWTVATVTTPTGSFTDSVGTHFQLITEGSSQSVQPSNPGGTTSTTGVMAGVGNTCKITPATTGRVRFTIKGNVTNNNASKLTTVQGRYGTGSAPAGGTALTGTLFDPGSTYTTTAAASPLSLFLAEGIVSGLNIGTQVWYDASIATNDNGTTSSIANMMCLAQEF